MVEIVMFVIWVASHLTPYRVGTLRRLFESLAAQTRAPDKVVLSVSFVPGVSVDFTKLFRGLPFPVCTLIQPKRCLQGEHWREIFKKSVDYDPKTWIYFIDDDDEILPDTIRAITDHDYAMCVQIPTTVVHDLTGYTMEGAADVCSSAHRWELVRKYFSEMHDPFMRQVASHWTVDLCMTIWMDTFEIVTEISGPGVGVLMHKHLENITFLGPDRYGTDLDEESLATVRCGETKWIGSST